MVIWLIGLSGAGKTTIGREVYRLWKAHASNTVLVDGDQIREIFQHTDPAAYSLAGRRLNSRRIAALCRWLDSQNINVVCPMLSIFQDDRDENRTSFSRYFEVYIEVEMDELIRRDSKRLYSEALIGIRDNVVGVDIPFHAPATPDLVIQNGNPYVDVHQAAIEILTKSGAIEC